MKDHYYSVADFLFKVSAPDDIDIENLLPSFLPFRCNGYRSSTPIFNFSALSETVNRDVSGICILEESMNEFGYVKLYSWGNGYYVEMSYTIDGAAHRMFINSDFTVADAYICWNDPYVSYICSSMLRVVYSQAILKHNAISVHAAAVYCDDGYAYLFMGKSGTGKSTHASLWVRTFPKCELLNDDNPTIRIMGECAYAYGTPWSGKTPCYKNMYYPIGGIVRLVQAKTNRFIKLEDVDAFVVLFPGCSLIRQNRGLCDKLYDILAKLSSLVVVGKLECRPEKDAALLCKNELVIYNKNQKNE